MDDGKDPDPLRRLPGDVSKIELNLAQFPIANYSHHKTAFDVETIPPHVKESLNGVILNSLKAGFSLLYVNDNFFSLVGSPYGVLSPLGELLLKAGVFSYLFEHTPKTPPKESTTLVYVEKRSELMKRLDIPDSGEYLNLVNAELLKIATLSFSYSAFYDKKKKEQSPLIGFPFFVESHIPTKKRKERGEYIFLVFNPLLAENIRQGFFWAVPIKVYLAFQTPVARRINEYVYIKLAGKEEYSENLKSFIGKIGIQTTHTTRAKTILKNNLALLQEKTNIKTNWKGEDIITFFRKERVETEALKNPQKTSEVQRRNELFCRIVKEVNIKTTQILELFHKFSLNVIENQLNWLSFRETKDNKAVFLQSVKENWCVPKKYEEYIKERRQNRKV